MTDLHVTLTVAPVLVFGPQCSPELLKVEPLHRQRRMVECDHGLREVA